MTTRIKIKKGAGTPSGLTFGELAYDLTNKKLFIGITGGNALLANTDGGVSQVNGATGSVTTYAGTTGNIQFRYGSGVTATSYFGLTTGNFSNITDILTLSGPTSADWWFGNQQAIGLKIERQFNGLGFDESGGVAITALGIGNDNGDIYGSNLKLSTPAGAALPTSISLSPGDVEILRVSEYDIHSNYIHYFHDGINSSTSSSTNTFAGPITGVTATFTGLLSASKGISAAGGVTLAGTLQGTTASFTGLVSSAVGFSGAGTNLTGNASGLTAGTATRVITTATNSASTFYPTFVSGAGNTALFIDPTLGPLSYVPSTATLKLTNLDIAAGALTIGAFQLTASTYFYFVASTGINFQDPTLISMGDYGAVAGKTLFEVYPTVGTRYACLYNSDWANNATLMVNRLSPVGTHAFEVNRSDGKAVKLIYGDTGGAASNYVDLDVSSAGNLTITPSGSLVTITGRLNVSAGISASGATFSAPITSTRMARHTSAAISAQQTADFSPTAADDGTVFYINYSGKGSVTVTFDSLPIGWRAKFLNVGNGAVYFESTGDIYGEGSTNGLLGWLREAICIDTNTYFVG